MDMSPVECRIVERLRAGFRDKRGATAVAFGVAATAVIGIVGLGTEGGTWYLTRRDAQNAADPAAYAGAVRLSLAQAALSQSFANARTQAINTATDTATRNGFTTGQANTTVTVNIPPASGPNAGNNTAVEVIVQRSPPRLISALFIGANPVIRARGVAALTNNGPACLLALRVGLTIQGNSSSGSGCSFSSNATTSTAININGNPTINATSLISSGGCNDCAGLPYQTYQPPTLDPYASLNSIAFAKPASFLPAPPKNQCPPVYPIPAGNFTGNISNTGCAWDFAPGTYIFWESSLDVSGGSLTCSACVGGAGVTFIFTGSSANKVGTVSINTNQTVQLSAPNNGPYKGILIYRDDLGTSSGNPEVQITGGPQMTLNGVIYAPTSYASFSGNSATNCLVLVASRIGISGTSNFSTAGCSTPLGVPQNQIVRLVE